MDFKVHHIGYVTDNIEVTANNLAKFGYEFVGDKIHDEIQRVYIQFMQLGEVKIELVQPSGEDSSVNKMLKKTGVAPYHICYEVSNINATFDKLIEDGNIPLFAPVEAVALNNRLIAYFYNKSIGFFEIVNDK